MKLHCKYIDLDFVLSASDFKLESLIEWTFGFGFNHLVYMMFFRLVSFLVCSLYANKIYLYTFWHQFYIVLLIWYSFIFTEANTSFREKFSKVIGLMLHFVYIFDFIWKFSIILLLDCYSIFKIFGNFRFIRMLVTNKNRTRNILKLLIYFLTFLKIKALF